MNKHKKTTHRDLLCLSLPSEQYNAFSEIDNIPGRVTTRMLKKNYDIEEFFKWTEYCETLLRFDLERPEGALGKFGSIEVKKFLHKKIIEKVYRLHKQQVDSALQKNMIGPDTLLKLNKEPHEVVSIINSKFNEVVKPDRKVEIISKVNDREYKINYFKLKNIKTGKKKKLYPENAPDCDKAFQKLVDRYLTETATYVPHDQTIETKDPSFSGEEAQPSNKKTDEDQYLIFAENAIKLGDYIGAFDNFEKYYALCPAQSDNLKDKLIALVDTYLNHAIKISGSDCSELKIIMDEILTEHDIEKPNFQIIFGEKKEILELESLISRCNNILLNGEFSPAIEEELSQMFYGKYGKRDIVRERERNRNLTAAKSLPHALREIALAYYSNNKKSWLEENTRNFLRSRKIELFVLYKQNYYAFESYFKDFCQSLRKLSPDEAIISILKLKNACKTMIPK